MLSKRSDTTLDLDPNLRRDELTVDGDLERAHQPRPSVFERELERLAKTRSAKLLVNASHEMDVIGAHRIGMDTGAAKLRGVLL